MTEPKRPRLPLSEAEAAERLGFGAATLRHRRRRGTGPPYIKWCGRALYDPLDVELERQRDLELRRRYPVIDSWR